MGEGEWMELDGSPALFLPAYIWEIEKGGCVRRMFNLCF